MTIGIDLSCLSESRSGMHRYAFWFSHYLKQRIPDCVQGFYFADSTGRLPGRGEGESAPLFSGWSSRVLREQLVIPLRAARDVDRLLVPAYLGPVFSTVPVDLIVYDFLYLRDDSGLSQKQRLYWHGLYRQNIRHADRLFPISRTTRRELIERFPECEERVGPVLYPGLAAENQACSPNKRSPESPYILCVGSVSPRKQFATFVEHFRDHPARPENLEVRVAGGYGWGSPHPREWHDPDNGIIWEGRVSPTRLQQLYRGATLLLLPSDGEGFGMPILEAFSHHVPVVLRDRAIFREVAANGAAYLPETKTDWPGFLGELLNDPVRLQRLVTRGTRRLRRFRWASSVEKYLNTPL